VDAGARQAEFIARLGAGDYERLTGRHRRRALELALAEADRRMHEIDWFVLPNLGRRRLIAEYLHPFGISWSRTAWPSWARRVGHLGAADQLAGLDFLLRTGRLGAGQTCMLVGAGGDVVSSCAVLEIIRAPQ
jgi:3-oxoacyl-[acyl-carrier-protein] synthase III